MAVQMDKPSELSSRQRAQHLYNKNVELENSRRNSAHARVPSDPNVWQQIRENYEAIILEDRSFSEQHEIELALWQLHYKRIEELRALYSATLSSSTSVKQNGKGGPAQSDRLARIRSQFKTFLSEASGFYHDLILKIRAKYGLPLGYFSDEPENKILLSKDGRKPTDMKKGLISCHRCLIYLGDLARYKGLYGDGESKSRDFSAASSYYMQASSLWPSSGNPHHQLAILAAYQGDELVAIYRYFRSLAAENSFTTARDNLIIAFERNRQSYSQLLGDSKTSSVKTATPRMNGKGRGKSDGRPLHKDNRNQSTPSKEKVLSVPETFKAFCVKFVRVNGILFTRTSLETFTDVLLMAKNDFMLLLSSGLEEKYNFGSDATECGLVIIRMVAILIYTVHNVNRESENQSYADILQRSVLLQNAYTAMFEFMGHIVERCMQLQDPLSSYLLPGVLMFVEWLACHPDVASGTEEGEKQANTRLLFWKSCISFFNKLLSSGLMTEDEDESCFFNMSKYEDGETTNRLALWEDFELRGFLPLLSAQQILDFSRKNSFGNDGGIKEKRTRVQRIIAAGKSFVNVVQVGQQVVYFDSNSKKFIFGAEPQQFTDFSLNGGPEMHMFSEMNQVKEASVGVLKPAVPLLEGEDEEEVIVFKPSAADKPFDGGYSVQSSCGDIGLPASISSEDLGVHTRFVSAPQSGVFGQNGFDLDLGPTISVGNAASPSLQPIQPSTTSWLVGQQTSMMNGFKNLSLMDAGNVMNSKYCESSSIAAAVSLPFSSSGSLNSGKVYSAGISEVGIPLKPVYSMSCGPDVGFNAIQGQLLSASARKSPVSRPIRQVGPPPGFASATPKYGGDPELGSGMKEESPLMDDYSWLDGYQMPPSTKQSTGFSTSTNLNGPLYNHIGKSSGTPGAISFPFPGKQTSGFQTSAESRKLWQDYQFPDQLKPYEQQQQHQQKGNQQHMSVPEYQGQSLWQGRYLV